MEITKILSAVCGKKKAGQMRDGYEVRLGDQSEREGERLEAND